MRALLTGFLLLACLPMRGLADDVVMPLARSAQLSQSEIYEFALLHEVMERTRSDYGAYQERPFTERLSLARATSLAIEGRWVNIMAEGVGQPLLESQMTPVPFPIDKGLLGYRVAFIDRHSQSTLSAVDGLEGLRRLRVGQGADWSDVDIYQHNRIEVVTAPSYKWQEGGGLFSMLLAGRFDLFPRGLNEINREFTTFGPNYPDLVIEQHLLLHYPFCEAFYVSPTTPRLSERLLAGLRRMTADGSFDALFNKFFGKTIANLNLGHRLLIEVANPALPAWVPIDQKNLWFDPARLP
jgi:hypothetical protein